MAHWSMASVQLLARQARTPPLTPGTAGLRLPVETNMQPAPNTAAVARILLRALALEVARSYRRECAARRLHRPDATLRAQRTTLQAVARGIARDATRDASGGLSSFEDTCYH
jgi:hypothetical protein